MTNNAAQKKPNWTVLVYMVADTGDSFYQDAMIDMGEMMSAQFDERVRVVVHADAPSPWQKKCWEVTGAPKATEAEGTKTQIGTAREIKCDDDGLLSFVQKVINNYESDYYLLVLWGHGEGIDWKQKVLAGHPPSAMIQGAGKRFAPGSQSAIEVGELGKALAGLNLRGLKRENVVVGFDACLMGMVEVYYEIQKYVGWAVAANDEIPDTGWPYKEILNLLGNDPAIEPRRFAESIVDICAGWYSQNSPESKVSFAACDLSKSLPLEGATRRLADKLKECIQQIPVYRAVSEARDLAEDLQERAYIDLYGFCRELEQRTEQEQLKAAAHSVVEQIIGGEQATGGFVMQHSFSDVYPYQFARNARAMSICFPESDKLEGSVPGIQINWGSYKDLTFSRYTDWPSFLEEFWDMQNKLRAAADLGKPQAFAATAGS
jgi:Clostripain family